MINIEKPKGWRQCNCCYKEDDVMEFYFRSNFNGGGICVALCRECRTKLREMLNNDLRKSQTDARPLQKPLSPEEAMERKIFWIENWAEIRPAVLNDVYSDKMYITVVYGGSGCNVFNADRYGKSWRCWATKPTDEEREAAEWDE